MPPESPVDAAPRAGFFSSIRFSILAIAITPALIGISLLTVYHANTHLKDEEAALYSRGRELAQHLAHAVEYEYFSGDTVYLKRLLDYTRNRGDIRALGVIDSGNNWLAVSGDASVMHAATWQANAGETLRNGLLFFYTPIGKSPTVDEDPYLGISVNADQPGSIVVALDTQPLKAEHRRTLWGTASLLTLFLTMTGILAWRMSSGLIGRLQGIARAVRRIASGQLDVRVHESASGELGELERGVNRMATALTVHQDELQHRIQLATSELIDQKQAAEGAALAKSRFLAAASHDLRQPLHALTLLVAALRERVSGSEAERLARHIESSALAMQELLNALLDLSKLDAGVIAAQPTCFAMGPVLESVQQQFAPLATSKHIELKIHPCSLWAYSDPVLVERILINLTSNAIRYTNQGRVVIGVRRQATSLCLEVADTGIGIPEDSQNRIFEEYFQLNNPERDRDKGLGLGLAIVSRIARLLETRVAVHSSLGQGARFSLPLLRCLPEHDNIEAEAPATVQTGLPANLTVAFIDDDLSILEAMVELFSQWDIDLAAGANVAQVESDLLELGRPPDLILSDYRLRNAATGIEAVARLRQTFGETIPAVLITGDTAPETIRAIDASGLPVLHKPLKPAKLRAMLTHLLSQRAS